jgi:hypothetical protein
MQLVQKVEVTRGQHGYISMSNCFPSFIVHWILNFVDQPTRKNHENWYPTNKSDFTVLKIFQILNLHLFSKPCNEKVVINEKRQEFL